MQTVTAWHQNQDDFKREATFISQVMTPLTPDLISDHKE